MTTSKAFGFTKWQSARDMMDDVQRLWEARASGELTREEFADAKDLMKTAAKLHGDNVREQAVHVAAKSNNVDVNTLPRIFNRVSLPPAK